MTVVPMKPLSWCPTWHEPAYLDNPGGNDTSLPLDVPVKNETFIVTVERKP